jgi:phi13 family phage major tail protein
MTKDDGTGRAYNAIVSTPGLQEVDIDPKYKETEVPGDDVTYETIKNFENAEVKIKMAEVPLSALEYFEGGDYDAGTGTYDFTKDSDAPSIGLRFKAPRTDGTFQGVKLWRVKVIKVKQSYKSAETVSVEIEGKAMASLYDGKVLRKKDSPDEAWLAAMESTDDVVAPTVACVPLDAAVDVAINSNIVWTADKDLLSSTVIAANVMVMKADGTPVAGAISYDVAGKTITFNPTADLANNTDYIAILTVGIRSASGVALAAPSTINFKTVA